jgi:hypothetical protein
MTPRNPFTALTNTALGAVTHPKETTGKVVVEVAGVMAGAAGYAAGAIGWAARHAGLGSGDERSRASRPSGVTEGSRASDPAPAPAPAPPPRVPPETDEAQPDLATTDPEASEVTTPSGIPAAAEGTNPDTAETDLYQPGTEPLVDPATVKAVKSETDTLRKASEPELE